MSKFVTLKCVADQPLVDGQYMYLNEVRSVRQDQAKIALKANPDKLIITEGEVEPDVEPESTEETKTVVPKTAKEIKAEKEAAEKAAKEAEKAAKEAAKNGND